jgi:hypothetical protein
MSIDIGVEDRCHESALWRESRIVVVYVEVEDECTIGVGGLRRLEERIS